MSDDYDLTEILGIDRDVALELAHTSSAIARARVGDRYHQPNRQREGEVARTGQTLGQVNLASLSRVGVGDLQTATLATQAAVNLLVVNQAEQACDLFRLASTLVAPYSSNDSVVLGTCADPLTAAAGEYDVADATLSGWVAETLALLQLATGSGRSFDLFDSPPVNDWVGAGASSQPPLGVSLARIVQSRIALSDAMPSNGPIVWNGVLAVLDDLVADATSPFEDAVGAIWWVNQTGSLFPIEPEILMLGLVGAIWRQRGLEFGFAADEGIPFIRRDRQSRLALGVAVAADRLLEARSTN